jgi:L-seryl-tRNA(Ser) seleniumtransferase
LYRDPDTAIREIPTLRMITATRQAVAERATAIAELLRARGIACDVVDSEAAVGGGAFPGARLPSAAIALSGSPVELEVRLRAGSEPIIGRIVDDRLLLDPRAIPEDRDEAFAATIVSAMQP